MKISILLCNFNHQKYLENWYGALRNQTYTDWELVLVDDGSTDDSAIVIDGIASQDSRVKPLYLKKNRGALAAADSGFPLLTGELLLMAAADDFLIEPNFFELVVQEMHARPRASGVFGRCQVIDAVDGTPLWTMGMAPSEGLNDATSILIAFFENRLFVPGASAIWRLPLVRNAGLLDPELGPQSDFYLNHALSGTGDGVVFIPSIVVAVRASTMSYSARATTKDFFVRHAKVEAKLRALPACGNVSETTIWNWRWCVINARLAVVQQRSFYSKIHEIATAVPASEKINFPEKFSAIIKDLVPQCVAMSAELEQAVKDAAEIFNQISGPLPGDPF